MVIYYIFLFSRQWASRKSQIKSKTRLIRAIARTFWWEISRLGFIQILNEVVIRLGQPLLLGRLLQTFRNGSGKFIYLYFMCLAYICLKFMVFDFLINCGCECF